MNACYTPFYLQPWVWFLIISIILFITFIILIEFNFMNTMNPLPEWVIILFIFILVFLFISFVMYFWYNRCLPVTTPVVEEVIVDSTLIVDQCATLCDDIKMDYQDKPLMPLSSLKPY